MSRSETRLPGGDNRELEALLLAGAAVAAGPAALLAAAALAALLRGRRLWLAALAFPSTAAAALLWPQAHLHLLGLAAAVRLTQTHGDPKEIARAAWPQLWPLWLYALTLTPLLALTILAHGRRSFGSGTSEDATPKRNARAERRAYRRAASEHERTGEQADLFLGYGLGGDLLLPSRRGRVYLPLPRLAHHLLVAGATGSGKTETVLRIAYSLAARSDWRIVYLDGKGDTGTQERFAALMEQAECSVALFPQQRYDGWRGSSEEIAGRLLQLIDFASEGGGTYYRDLAVSAVRLACTAPDSPPRSSNELLRRLSQRALTTLHAGRPQAADARALRPEDLDGIRARYAAFFTTAGDLLDGTLNLDDIDTAYFLLDGLRLKHEAGYLARFLTEEFTQWATGRKPRGERVLLIVDEFSAIAQTSRGLIDLVERARSFGVAVCLCPQVAEGMGGPEATARIVGSAHTILLHQTALPSQLVDAAGTRRVYEYAHQLEEGAATGLGSARLQHAYRVDLDDVRRLKPGQCFAIGSGLAMKLQIAAAPPVASLTAQSAAGPQA